MSTKLDSGSFQRLRSIVHDQVGIFLGPHKGALVQARVGKRLRALGLSSYEDYLDLLETDETGSELTYFVDEICTNVTSFFREPQQFEFVVEQMRTWLRQGQRRFRLWSCACSSGEEPYSLAMSVLDALEGHSEVDVRILATDISTKVLDRCLEGCYDPHKLTGVPPEWRSRGFDDVIVGDVPYARVSDELRKMILFKRMNLSTPPFPMKGPLDIVMCRNVMIYFDNDVRAALLEEIHRLLKPGGFLIVGHAESLIGTPTRFKYLRPAIYVRR